MLTIGIACTALAVFLTVTAIGWPKTTVQHLRPLRKAYHRPLTLMGYPTPPLVADPDPEVVAFRESLTEPQLAELEFWRRIRATS